MYTEIARKDRWRYIDKTHLLNIYQHKHLLVAKSEPLKGN